VVVAATAILPASASLLTAFGLAADKCISPELRTVEYFLEGDKPADLMRKVAPCVSAT
jgi:hypothetical protein